MLPMHDDRQKLKSVVMDGQEEPQGQGLTACLACGTP
jgi:hypothetical protein